MNIINVNNTNSFDKKSIFSVIHQVCKNNDFFKNKTSVNTDLDEKIENEKILKNKLKLLKDKTLSNHNVIETKLRNFNIEIDSLKNNIFKKLGVSE